MKRSSEMERFLADTRLYLSRPDAARLSSRRAGESGPAGIHAGNDIVMAEWHPFGVWCRDVRTRR